MQAPSRSATPSTNLPISPHLSPCRHRPVQPPRVLISPYLPISPHLSPCRHRPVQPPRVRLPRLPAPRVCGLAVRGARQGAAGPGPQDAARVRGEGRQRAARPPVLARHRVGASAAQEVRLAVQGPQGPAQAEAGGREEGRADRRGHQRSWRRGRRRGACRRQLGLCVPERRHRGVHGEHLPLRLLDLRPRLFARRRRPPPAPSTTGEKERLLAMAPASRARRGVCPLRPHAPLPLPRASRRLPGAVALWRVRVWTYRITCAAVTRRRTIYPTESLARSGARLLFP